VVLRSELERTKRGLTQTELAHRVGSTQQKISEVERGLRHEPTLRALEQFFGMRRELLLRPIPASLNTEAQLGKLADNFTDIPPAEPRHASDGEAPPPIDLAERIRIERGQP
jgi:transcriptional regulator with XRE-family HTH domain